MSAAIRMRKTATNFTPDEEFDPKSCVGRMTDDEHNLNKHRNMLR